MGIAHRKVKLTKEQGDALCSKSETLINLSRIDDRIATRLHAHFIDMLARAEFDQNLIQSLGKPSVVLHDYEAEPGLWLIDDTDTGITFLITSYEHRKNARKGTRYDVIVPTDKQRHLVDALERFLDSFKPEESLEYSESLRI